MSKLILNQNGVRRKIDFSSPTPLSTVLDMLPHPCGGKGFCGKCRVRIMGKISAPTAAERTMLSREQLRDGVRLACQVTLNGDAQVTVADTAAPAKATSSDVPRKKPLGEKYGLSIDLGTTTICAAVFDLQTGKRCTEGSAANPQARYSADVLSRVESAIQGNGNELSRCIRHALFDLCAQVMMTAKLAPGDVEAEVAALAAERAKRRETEPAGRSAGCVFRNASPDAPAGMLVDRCGLRGARIGGVEISEKHANYIVNASGNASEADFLAAAKLARRSVKERFGVELKPEVRFISAESEAELLADAPSRVPCWSRSAAGCSG